MKLRDLLAGVPLTGDGPDLEMEINSISCDTRTLQPGALFIALSGDKTDGHRYIRAAVEQGAAAVPDVTGMTYEGAKNALEKAGFFMRASGVSVYYSNPTKAASQSVPPGDTAAVGTVVNVQFQNVIQDRG